MDKHVKGKKCCEILKNEKVAGIDETTGETIQNFRKCVVEWVWKIFCMSFETGSVAKDLKNAIIIRLYKLKIIKMNAKIIKE